MHNLSEILTVLFNANNEGIRKFNLKFSRVCLSSQHTGFTGHKRATEAGLYQGKRVELAGRLVIELPKNAACEMVSMQMKSIKEIVLLLVTRLSKIIKNKRLGDSPFGDV